MKTIPWQKAVWPIVVMVILLGVILISHKGMPLESRPAMLEYLPEEEAEGMRQTAVTSAVLYASSEKRTAIYETLSDTLTAVRTPYIQMDLSAGAEVRPESYETVYFCSQNLSWLMDEAQRWMDWVESGGQLVLMMTPNADSSLDVFSRKLGISEIKHDYHLYTSLRFTGGMLPSWDKEEPYAASGYMSDYALPVRLDPQCRVYMESADKQGVPLLWSLDHGDGRIVVNNNTLVQGKDSRGFALQAVLALKGTLVYPIINAGMMFIDDFPAPQPAGFDERLLDEFGYDIAGFYRNHWWPDMKKLTWNDGLRYTGVLIETYNDRVEAPFEPDTDERALIRYYASELLQSGGEIGLHGYNHMPLCLDGFPYAGEGYVTWPSTENMSLALQELFRYGGKFLPSAYFKVYVPPSNYLSDEGKETLLKTIPQIRTVSGLYLPETGVKSLTQEFAEEADGSVSVPRITAGFSMDEYNRFIAASELMLHGVFSHFIHPDDVLDAERGADLGWHKMYEDFVREVNNVKASYPPLRWSTGSEGAAAVQRYSRVQVAQEEDENGLTLTLTPFYDEAWLAVKTEHPIERVENANAYPICEGLYWLQATGGKVVIEWGSGE